MSDAQIFPYLCIFFLLLAFIIGLLWRITHALERGARDLREIAQEIKKLTSGNPL